MAGVRSCSENHVLAEIHIALNDDGQLAASQRGPAANNKIVLLGMLEQAKALILNPPEKSPIVAAVAVPNVNGSKR